MFGKLGRSGGAGRGSNKRPLSTPVQFHRPGDTGGTRLPIGASAPPRARTGAPSVAGAMPGREETFSLEPGLIDFGSIIRLTPDLVEEIRRLEAQGGSAKIKFDANANNSAGNVVEVGGKEFRFTWSRELTDLCDIYEERRNGDDGDGLLVECGAAWRKLNVQRILDESTKNHVKMRSEEAERMLKSRKAIVLDPTNPSVKSQAKSMAAAAVEGNMRRMGWKHKKDMFFKKRKAENSHGVTAASQAKSVSKSTKSSNGNFKGIPSPLPSPQQPRSRAALSTTGIVNTIRGDANLGEITPPLNINKEEIEIVEQEVLTSAARNSMLDKNWESGDTDPSVDLRSMLLSLLAQNPKGMSLKALEKVVGERIPSSVRKIDNVLKNIATFQAPGRYFLKQGFQAESSKKSFEGGSPPEHLNKQTTGAFSMSSDKVIVKSSDIETLSAPHGDGFDAFEKIDMIESTEDPLDIEGKFRDNSVVRAGSDSESLSDSDSESDSSSESDSGSQSRSRSKSRSPAASGSGSESDGSSSSKEVSDVNVDIMTSDDEKGITVQRIDAAVPMLSSPLCVLRSGGENDSFERVQKANDPSFTSDLLGFESMNQRVNTIADAKSLSIDRTSKLFEKLEAKTVESIDSCLQQSKSISSVDEMQFSKERIMFAENLKVLPYGNSFNDRQKLLGRKSFHEQQSMMKDGSSEQPNSHEKVIKTVSKRSTNSECFQENSENAKRMKTLNSAEGKKRGARSLETSYYLSPGRSQHMDQKIKMSNDHQRDGTREINLLDGSLLENAKPADSGSTEKIHGSPDYRGVPNLAVDQSSRNVSDSSGRKKIFTMEKSIKNSENLGRANKHQQTVSGPESDISDLKNLPVDKISTVKKRTDENTDALDKYRAKLAVESYVGDKALSASGQIGRKYTDGHILHQHNPNANGRGNFLRRELSDLELGEFREPSTDGMVEDKGQFERNGSLKNKENRVTVSETNATDISLVKCDRNSVPESKRQSPNSFKVGVNGKISADVSLDLSQSQPRVVQPRSWKSSRNDAAESESMTHLIKCAEYSSKNGTRTGQIIGLENEASCPNRSAATRIHKDGKRYDSLDDNKDVKGSKSQKPKGVKGSTDHVIDGLLSYNGIDSRESLESSSDEENASYMKYNKEEQRPRGPIKDFCVYKDYVQQFKERFRHYSFLNKKLEKNRIEFLKVGDDIEHARGRNMGEYYSLVENLRQMYHQRGERHKQMKKIFILLHEDLKALKQRIKDFAERRSGESAVI